MDFFEVHYQKLQETKCAVGDWNGRIPHNWFNAVMPLAARNSNMTYKLSKNKVSRSELFDMARDTKNISIESCCVSIFAWGGMKKAHGVALFSRNAKWLILADEIRQGKYDRAEAYNRFSKLRANGDVPGMGPAYFTKLIFFLQPSSPRGYIMDQWTSASINLLFGQIVKTKVSKQAKGRGGLDETVCDSNSSVDYELFCAGIEHTAKRLGVRPEHAEEMMFSKGGKHKGAWRQHVISERLKNASTTKGGQPA